MVTTVLLPVATLVWACVDCFSAASESELYHLLSNVFLPLGRAKYYCWDGKISYTEPPRTSYYPLTIINLSKKHSLLEVLLMYMVFAKENGLVLWIILLELYHFSIRKAQKVIHKYGLAQNETQFIFLIIILNFTV